MIKEYKIIRGTREELQEYFQTVKKIEPHEGKQPKLPGKAYEINNTDTVLNQLSKISDDSLGMVFYFDCVLKNDMVVVVLEKQYVHLGTQNG